MNTINYPVTIAYNMADKKIACVLIQAAMAATIPASWVSATFSPDIWELNPSKCRLYTINSEQELDLMIRLTKEN